MAAAARRPTGKGPCKEPAQCRKGVCVEINEDSYCSQTCGRCPAGMYCDDKLFGMMNLKVCVKGSLEEPPKPKSPPKLPCKTDDQCPGALICAQMMGQRDCTIQCTTDARCKMPEMMGVKFDFMACGLDEGRRGRKACLPKKECIANPMACMGVNSRTMGGMMGMAGAMEQDMAGGSEPTAPWKQAMSESRFNSLLGQVKDASFEDERTAVLDTASKRNYFNCDQVGRVLGVISFSDEKISALRILAPRLVDKENSHTILAHFEFDDDKQKARRILNK